MANADADVERFSRRVAESVCSETQRQLVTWLDQITDGVEQLYAIAEDPAATIPAMPGIVVSAPAVGASARCGALSIPLCEEIARRLYAMESMRSAEEPPPAVANNARRLAVPQSPTTDHDHIPEDVDLVGWPENAQASFQALVRRIGTRNIRVLPPISAPPLCTALPAQLTAALLHAVCRGLGEQKGATVDDRRIWNTACVAAVTDCSHRVSSDGQYSAAYTLAARLYAARLPLVLQVIAAPKAVFDYVLWAFSGYSRICWVHIRTPDLLKGEVQNDN